MNVNIPDNNKLEQIVELCKKNNRKAQKDLYDLFSKKFFIICLRYSTDYSEAEDMLQEGFIKLYAQINKFNKGGYFKSWAGRLIANNCIDMIRKKPNLYAITDFHANSLETSTINALDKMIGDDVLNIIQSLPTGYRTIFNMYVIEGFSHKEIAERLNIKIGTSKSQLNRAKNLLQKKLKEINNYDSLQLSNLHK